MIALTAALRFDNAAPGGGFTVKPRWDLAA
jgi:hypothetical protein